VKSGQNSIDDLWTDRWSVGVDSKRSCGAVTRPSPHRDRENHLGSSAVDAARAHEEIQNDEVAETPTPVAAAKILVVDDHPANQLAVEAVLESLGRPIVRASSGEEALRRVLDDEFAVILMDVQMPGMDGFKTVSILRERERTRSTPVIFLTAINKAPQHVSRGYAEGAVDYIFKPFDPAILRAKVAVFLELHEARERVRTAEIEKRRRERAELEEAVLRRYKRMMDAMPHCVWAARRDGSIYYVNRAAREYLGAQSAGTLLERSVETVHPDDLARVRTAWAQCLRSGQRAELQLRLRRHDGSYRWFRAEAVPEREGPIGVSGWLVTAVDVEELRALIASKDDFVASASHELRTPLAAARAQADLAARLHEKRADPDRLKKAIDHVRGQLGRMGVLVSELLDVACAQQGTLRVEAVEMDLATTLRECVQRAASISDRHQVVLDAPESIPMTGDPSRLDQVFTNLLSNAVRYSPDGGTIEVVARAEDGRVTVAVRDHGVGIPRDQRDRIFERFGRAHGSRYGGLGLGLAIARAIVDLHGGAIEVQSNGVPGEGTTFTVRLPHAAPKVASG
jgi:PAS domain S-box-containing protein